jgi:[ribosomal protein S5]-alanine N-acetyltransferase
MEQIISKDFTIKTARCLLRCPSEDDIPHIFSATRVVGFNDGMLWEPPANMDELYKPLQENLLAWEAGTAFAFTMTALHSKIFLGRIGIRKTEQMNVWNIGFWTHPEHQRQGYMTESAQALMEFGFDRLGAIRLEAAHALWNKGSQRVLENIGMKFAAFIPQGFQKKGQWIEENKMGITKEEWLGLDHVEQAPARETEL